MPVSRSHLTRPKPRQAVIDLGDGDTVNVVFNANAITPAWMRAAQERDNEQNPLSLPAALAEVILSWDITEDDGSEFAATRDNIAEFSFPVQNELLLRIIEAAVPSSEEGNASANTSSTASTVSLPAPAIPQNGERPSESVPSSASPSVT